MIVVTVTQEYINIGEKGLACLCPIALAVNELLSEGFLCSVGCNYAYVHKKDSLNQRFVHAELSSLACSFRYAFDHDLKEGIKPFSFGIDIPRQYLKQAV